MVWRFIKFGVKAGVSAALIEYTIEQGVWSSSDKSTKIYGELYNVIAPYVKEVPVEAPQLPRLSDIKYVSQHYWNRGVKNTIYFIQHVPNYAVDYSKKGWEVMLQFAESPGTPDREYEGK